MADSPNPIIAIPLATPMAAMWYDPETQIAEREWILNGLLPMGTFVGWIGPEKSEKSLFGMRQGMCISSGCDWNNYDCTKPRVVSYLDAENSEQDLHDRYHELLKEFSREERALIHENFHLVNGRKLVASGMSLNYTNSPFWKQFVRDWTADVFYLDCLYMFHNKSAKDNEGLLEVLQGLRTHCGYDKCVVALHHTRKRSDEELGKTGRSNAVSLRNIGIRTWSDKAYGGGTFKKYADVIVGQERFDKKDGNGNVTESHIDWQGYGRMIPDTPMLSFDADGDDKYRRHLVTNLSQGAEGLLIEMRKQNQSWASRHELAKSVKTHSRSRIYDLIEELKIKGRVLIDENGGVSLK